MEDEKQTAQSEFPIIAIIGRPNVGKSTLFNRIIGKRKAITSHVAGTTRDRIYHQIAFGALQALLVDTGGLSFEKKDDIESDIQTQTLIALNEADVIVFVVDAGEELTSPDYEAAQLLRKTNKPVLLVAHKADRSASESAQYTLYELGLGDPILVSALHGTGIDQLTAEITNILEPRARHLEGGARPPDPERENTIHVCFLGKPNVGKSSLVNRLCGAERVIVSEIPGTTVDSTDTILNFEDQRFNLIDTAGMRRSGKVEKGIEKYSVMRSLEAIIRSDVVFLILDASEGITHQDLKVSSYVLDAGRGLIIVMNKCDLSQVKESRDQLISMAQEKMAYMPWAPLVFTSAVTGEHVTEILRQAIRVNKSRREYVKEEDLKRYLNNLVAQHPPHGTGRPQLYSVTQTSTAPPTFTFRTNRPTSFHFSYRRFMENALREKFGFEGTPIRIAFKQVSAPRKKS